MAVYISTRGLESRKSPPAFVAAATAEGGPDPFLAKRGTKRNYYL